jgi:hypothetical protein
VCLDVSHPVSKATATNHGRVAVIISNRLTHKLFHLPAQPSTFAHLCFTITKSAKTVVKLLIYRQGTDAVSDAFFTDLSTVLETVTQEKCQIIVAGDLNIYVNRDGDEDARKLCDILDCNQQIPHEPTHTDGGTLDIVIKKSQKSVKYVSVNSLNVISDHSLNSWQLHLLHQPPR